MLKLAVLSEFFVLAAAVRLKVNSSWDPYIEAARHRKMDIPLSAGDDPWKRPACQPEALCMGPFHCEEGHWDTSEVLAGPDGRANYRSWCGHELPFRYENGAIKCAHGKLGDYGHAILDSEILRKPGSGQGGAMFKSIFAHHCFSQGFCDDTNVTEKTNIEEAEELCDQRYGRENWSTLKGKKIKAMTSSLETQELLDDEGLHFTPEYERLYAMAGCAQGVHHCDVHWCKTFFCTEGDWRAFAKPSKFTKSQTAFTYRPR